MSQTESRAEAIVDLDLPKPKRKPRVLAKAPPAAAPGNFSDNSDMPVATAPKVRRVRRSKVVAVAEPVVAPEQVVAFDVIASDALVADSAGVTPQAENTEPPCAIELVPVTEPSALMTGEATRVCLPATPRVHPDVLALARAVRGGRYALLPEFGEDALLGMRLMPDAATPPDPYCALVLTLPGGLIELGDGVRLLVAMTGIDLGHSAVELPNTQWLHSAVIGRLGQTPLRDVTTIARGGLPDAHGEDGNSEAPTVWQSAHITLRSRQHAFSIQARASAVSWLDLMTRTRWQREYLPTEVFDAMPVRLPVLIGTHVVSQSMLIDIAPGDVLLPDTAAFDCAGNGRLCWRGMQLNVTFSEPAALTILNMESRMEQHDAAADDGVTIHVAPTDPAALADGALDGLPVQLRFEMGRCDTTLNCLRTLAAGTVLPIEGGSPSSIAVVANGRQLGRGELVEVNGQLGIRITHWSA